MTKKVNIYPTTPIISVIPVIRTVIKNADKDTATIRKCILSRAKVEEILPSGDVITLDLTNYDKDNRFDTKAEVKEAKPSADSKTAVPTPEPEVEAPIKEEPVVDEAPQDTDKAPEAATTAEDEATEEEATTEEEVETPVEDINAALDNIDTSDIADEDDGLSDDELGM